jgi:hypothetical protein
VEYKEKLSDSQSSVSEQKAPRNPRGNLLRLRLLSLLSSLTKRLLLLLALVLLPPMFPPDESSLLIHVALSLIVMAHCKSERTRISGKRVYTETTQADVRSCHNIASSDRELSLPQRTPGPPFGLPSSFRGCHTP